jgi:hypothetical protein
LWRETRQTSSRHWFSLLPFLLAWGSTAAAGGYWVAWELGPRFLVVALPGLAPLLALAWRSYYRYKIWLISAALLLILSLANTWVILQNPELSYKSSLPLYYGERLGLPLTEWLPDLAGYATLSAQAADPAAAGVVTENGQTIWFAEAKRRSPLIPTTTLSELPFGHYHLTWPVRAAPNLPPESAVLQLTANFLGGGQLFNKSITAGELPADGSYGRLETQFLNTNVDRWRTPLLLGAESSGVSPVWAGDLTLRPTFLFAWVLPYTFLLLLLAVAGATWWAAAIPEKAAGSMIRRLRLGPGWLTGSVLALLLLSTGGYLIYQKQQSSYTYDASALSHFVGQPVSDPAAEDGRAWRVDPAVDPPQKAIYGPFDFYEPGLYHVTFRIKLPDPVEGNQAVAQLQVNATANFEPLVSQALRPEHFSQTNSYHHFVLIVNNPRHQALSFDVVYTALAPLVIDGVLVERVEGE